MKTYRQFAVRVLPEDNPTRLIIHDPRSDVKKEIKHDPYLNEIMEAADYLSTIGIHIDAIAPANRRRDIRLLTTSEEPLR